MIRQHFDALPKRHKLLLGVISAVLLATLIFPSSNNTSDNSSDAISPGERISIALPDSLQDPNQPESIIVKPSQLKPEKQRDEKIKETLKDTNDVEEGDVISKVSDKKSAEKNHEAEELLANRRAVDESDTQASGPLSNSASEVEEAETNHSAITDELMPGQRYTLAIDESILTFTEELPQEEQEWRTYVVKNGDNLAKIFSRAGLSAKDVHHVSRAGKHAKKLLKIRPGQAIELQINSDGGFTQLNYPFSPTNTLNIRKENNQYHSKIEEKEVYSRLNYASGEIRSNFWNAGVDAGLTDNQIMSLATIFGWDIDFALDIRAGDNFNVIYEENYIEGEFVGYGDIVAAEFTNQGEDFAAVRYKDGNYYTPAGRSMRKSFLRAPVNFKYISSSFKPRRFHPVQKRWKAHNGIDYAASTGTPVVAAGDGKVTQSSYNRFNGNFVFIQHGDTYTTKYLHFSKRAVKTGQWVKQGQVIGYVGATGLASGPHLHYEFLVNGKHKNPRTVKLPKALPIAKKEKAEFLALARDYKAKLDNNRRIMLAMN